MHQCHQTDSQTIYEHGASVSSFLARLIQGDTTGFRLPAWFTDHQDFILSQLPPLEWLTTYALYHDCGKPFCLSVDEQGRRHFPDHAEVSYATWMEHAPSDTPGLTTIAQLIRYDMAFHAWSVEDIRALNLPTSQLCALMLSALAELHANASMFGGIESDSFKIKFKRLGKKASALLKELNPAPVEMTGVRPA